MNEWISEFISGRPAHIKLNKNGQTDRHTQNRTRYRMKINTSLLSLLRKTKVQSLHTIKTRIMFRRSWSALTQNGWSSYLILQIFQLRKRQRLRLARTWNTVTSDQWSVSKFLRLHVHRLDMISPHEQMCWSSTWRQNLPPNRCIPSTLCHGKYCWQKNQKYFYAVADTDFVKGRSGEEENVPEQS